MEEGNDEDYIQQSEDGSRWREADKEEDFINPLLAADEGEEDASKASSLASILSVARSKGFLENTRSSKPVKPAR